MRRAWRLLYMLAMILFWGSLPNDIAAQKSPDLQQYNARIDRFLEAAQRDSFLYYSQLKANLARQNDSLRVWAWTRCKIRRIYANEPSLAVQSLEETIGQCWRAPRTEGEWEAILEINLRRSGYLLDLGNILKAVQAYEATRVIGEQHRYSDVDLVESVYKPLGNCYTRLGDNEKSLAIFQKALTLAKSTNAPESLAGLYDNIGIAYWNQGDFATAETYYQQGLQLFAISDQKRALLLEGLACAQLDDGKLTEALQNANAALALLRRLGKTAQGQQSGARLLAGQAYTRMGQYAPAQRLLAGALADADAAGVAPRDIGKIEVARAALFCLQDQPNAALVATNRALSVLLPAFPLHNVEENPPPSSFYEENTIIEALERKAAAAAACYAKDKDLRWLRLALDCHDLAYQAEIRLRNVFQYRSSKLGLQNAARVREQAAMDITRLLFEKTGDPAYITKAFALAERSKSALLREALQQNIAQRQAATGDARFGQLTLLKRSIAILEKDLLLTPKQEQAAQWQQQRDDLLAQVHTLERALQESHVPGLGNPQQELQGVNFETLLPGETFLEYFVGEQTIDVLIRTAGQAPVWHRLDNDTTLRRLNRQFAAYFGSAAAMLKDPGGYLQTAYALWQRIVPTEANQATRLTIVPDGFLHFIPFEALVTAAPGSSLRQAAYLIRRQQVRYAWSWASLQAQNALHSRAPESLLGIAPLFANGERGLSALEAGPSEWAGFAADQFVGKQATTQHVLAAVAQYRVLHFSTHAFAEGPPRIELYDQALLLPDLYALPLEADLVVLSACETGLGAEQKGEGVMSLARAFGQSGASCIISSLWRVNDQSTGQLFATFYQYLHDGLPTDAALQAAKVQYLNDPNVGAQQQTPYFWAGFVAVGADRTIELNTGLAQYKMIGWLLGGGLLLGLLWRKVVYLFNFLKALYTARCKIEP